MRLKAKNMTEQEFNDQKEDSDYDEAEDIYWNQWQKPERDKGPDRCMRGHGLHRCEATPILVLDLEDGTSYNTKNSGECMYKYCKMNDNNEGGGTGALMIDYLSEVFYACKYDSCHFAVHEKCYGGQKGFS